MAKKFDPKARAKRQKIVAAALGVILLAVMAYEVPSVLKIMNKKPAPPPVAAAPAPAAPVTGAATPVSAPAGSSGTLANTDPAPGAGSGQLVSFDRFSGKDPFAQQQLAATAPAAAKSSTPAAVPPVKPKPPPPGPKQPAARPTSARISVNGAAETVDVSQGFPKSDPVFVLVSVTKTSAKISIAGGSLSSGKDTVTLKKGKKVTLMNTADGTRYDLLLISTS